MTLPVILQCRPELRRAAIAALLLLLAVPTAAVEVAETRWGFDGRVVPQRMNPLSVLLTDTTGDGYDGFIELRKGDGVGQRTGAALVEPCYVAPFTSRWVQFYPYVSGEHETWSLALGKRKVELPRPKTGAPATVCLSDSEEPFGRAAGVRSFPDHLFPTTVSATDALGAVLIDHAPRWEPSKRQALLDWVRRGGTVHVLLGKGGEFPQFTGELSVLNTEDPQTRMGAGIIVRHQARREEVDARFLSGRGFAPRAVKEGSGRGPWKLEDGIFQVLKRLVRPDHDWGFIYLTLLSYLVLVAPVNWLIGRKTRGFARPLGFFLLCVVVFGGVLSFLGRRGYGETATVSTVSYAVPVGDRDYDVTQWTDAFATNGDYYALTHPGAHNLYSTCQDFERVNGIIENGASGRFLVDIPLFSSRSFLHRGRMEGHDLGVELVRWKQGDGPLELDVAVGPGFPEDPLAMWALAGGNAYTLSRTNDGRLTASGRGSPYDVFFSGDSMDLPSLYYDGMYPDYGELPKAPRAVFGRLVKPLMARAIGGTEHSAQYLDGTPFQGDCVQVFVFTESPPGFGLQAEGLGNETGYVLYHVPLFGPGS